MYIKFACKHAYVSHILRTLGKSLHITTENPDKHFKHKVWHFKICLFEENYAVVFTTETFHMLHPIGRS